MCSDHLTRPRLNTTSPKEWSSPTSPDTSCHQQQEICYRGPFRPPEEREASPRPFPPAEKSLPFCMAPPSSSLLARWNAAQLTNGLVKPIMPSHLFHCIFVIYQSLFFFFFFFLLIIILCVCCTFSNLSLFGRHFSVFQTSVYFIKLLNFLLY